MKTTGITRRIDELGRIVIPKEIRKNMHLKPGELLEIFLNDYFVSVDYLLALLLKTPILDDFSEIKGKEFEHRTILEKDLFDKYVKRYKTEKGILLKRVLYGIVAKK